MKMVWEELRNGWRVTDRGPKHKSLLWTPLYRETWLLGVSWMFLKQPGITSVRSILLLSLVSDQLPNPFLVSEVFQNLKKTQFSFPQVGRYSKELQTNMLVLSCSRSSFTSSVQSLRDEILLRNALSLLYPSGHFPLSPQKLLWSFCLHSLQPWEFTALFIFFFSHLTENCKWLIIMHTKEAVFLKPFLNLVTSTPG